MVSLPLSALHLLKMAVQRPSRLLVMSELSVVQGKVKDTGHGKFILKHTQDLNSLRSRTCTAKQGQAGTQLHSDQSRNLPSTSFLWQKCLFPNNLKSRQTNV